MDKRFTRYFLPLLLLLSMSSSAWAQGISIDSVVVDQEVTCPGDSSGAFTVHLSGPAPYTIQIVFTNIVITTNDSTHTFSNLPAGSYFIAAGKGLIVDDVRSVFLDEPPTFSMNSTVSHELCLGQNNGSISISPSGGTGGYSYLWSTGATGTSISGLAPGDYSVDVTDDNGCVYSETFTVNPGTDFRAGFTATPNCMGQPVVFTDTSSGVDGSTTYTWNFGADASSPTANTAGPHNITYGSAGTKTITLTIDNGSCSSTITETITVNPQPTITVSPDVAICEGNDTQLTASGAGLSFVWSPATGLDDPNIANPVASPTSTTTYTVTGTDANGCSGTEQVTVTVNPNPCIDHQRRPNHL